MKPQDENRKLREYIRQSRQRRRWRRLTVALATAAAVLTLCVMVLPAVTMESTPQTLACQLDLHTHTDSCYDEEGELVCGYADFVAHTHDSSCLLYTSLLRGQHEGLRHRQAQEPVQICHRGIIRSSKPCLLYTSRCV